MGAQGSTPRLRGESRLNTGLALVRFHLARESGTDIFSGRRSFARRLQLRPLVLGRLANHARLS
jgi:hypothetical protein